MIIPTNPKPISIAIEFAIHEKTDLNVINEYILEYSRLGWVLEERRFEVDHTNEFYTHKEYIKLTRR